MAFEIAHTQLRFDTLSPRRRLLALLVGLAFLAGLIWSCVTAYHAQPIDLPEKPAITPDASPRAIKP